MAKRGKGRVGSVIKNTPLLINSTAHIWSTLGVFTKQFQCIGDDISQLAGRFWHYPTGWKGPLVCGEVRLSNALLPVVVLGVIFQHVQHLVVIFLGGIFRTCTGTTCCTHCFQRHILTQPTDNWFLNAQSTAKVISGHSLCKNQIRSCFTDHYLLFYLALFARGLFHTCTGTTGCTHYIIRLTDYYLIFSCALSLQIGRY